MSGSVRVIKIRINGSQALILRESEKAALWEYVVDWDCTAELEFTTMTEAELKALPEFEGF